MDKSGYTVPVSRGCCKPNPYCLARQGFDQFRSVIFGVVREGAARGVARSAWACISSRLAYNLSATRHGTEESGASDALIAQVVVKDHMHLCRSVRQVTH